MVNLVGSMRCSHSSIRNIRALEMGSDIWVYYVAWHSAVPSIIRGTSLVPLFIFAKKYDSIMRMMKIMEE